ncbi:hypothetical protein Emed_002896 [Eimeria media]
MSRGGRVAAAAAATTAAAGVPLWLLSTYRSRAAAKSCLYTRSIKDCVYLDFAIGSKYAGRVLIGLYSDALGETKEVCHPPAAAAFAAAAAGAQGAAGDWFAGG